MLFLLLLLICPVQSRMGMYDDRLVLGEGVCVCVFDLLRCATG